MRWWLYLALGSAALTTAACGDATADGDAAPPQDALVISDVPQLADAISSLSWVEFAIAGCLSQDSRELDFRRMGPAPGHKRGKQSRNDARAGGVADAGDGDDRSDAGDSGTGDAGRQEACIGRVPLEVRFAAVAGAPIAIYDWEFGDGARSDRPSPVHVFEMPGVYSVTLAVGGPGGTADVAKIGVIEALPAEFADRCAVDAQCGSGRECICGNGTLCRPGLERGICTQGCGMGTPCTQGVCGDLAASNPTNPQTWQRSLCLLECADDSECPAELTCHEFPAAIGSGWVRGCFAPGVVGRVGDSCFDAAGVPDHDRCASGFCANLGARGACSASCASDGCPPSSTCAGFVGPSGDLCVLRCTGQRACASDPWLACEEPGGTGALDFTVDEPAAPGGYCAPRSCGAPGECGTDGRCIDGFCVAGT